VASGARVTVALTARLAASPTPVTYILLSDPSKTGTDAFAPVGCFVGSVNLGPALTISVGTFHIACAGVSVPLTLRVTAKGVD
jgi:hypothetical protein